MSRSCVFLSLRCGWFVVFSWSSFINRLVFGTIYSLVISGGPECIVQAIQAFGLGAIKVEPPITNEVILIEDGPIRAKK